MWNGALRRAARLAAWCAKSGDGTQSLQSKLPLPPEARRSAPQPFLLRSMTARSESVEVRKPHAVRNKTWQHRNIEHK